MNDITETIEGFYKLLEEKLDIKKREINVANDLNPNFNQNKIFHLEQYIRAHLTDIAPYLEQKQLSIVVPLNRWHFEPYTDQKYHIFDEGGHIIAEENGEMWSPGLSISLGKNNGSDRYFTGHRLFNHTTKNVLVTAEKFRFLENYEGRMKDLQEVIGILTGKLQGKIGYTI